MNNNAPATRAMTGVDGRALRDAESHLEGDAGRTPAPTDKAPRVSADSGAPCFTCKRVKPTSCWNAACPRLVPGE